MLWTIEKYQDNDYIVSDFVDTFLRINGFNRGIITFIENPYTMEPKFSIGERLYTQFTCDGVVILVIIDSKTVTVTSALTDYQFPSIDIDSLDESNDIGFNYDFSKETPSDTIHAINYVIEKYVNNKRGESYDNE